MYYYFLILSYKIPDAIHVQLTRFTKGIPTYLFLGISTIKSLCRDNWLCLSMVGRKKRMRRTKFESRQWFKLYRSIGTAHTFTHFTLCVYKVNYSKLGYFCCFLTSLCPVLQYYQFISRTQEKKYLQICCYNIIMKLITCFYIRNY